MTRSVEAILFDAGGVLLHPNFDWIAAQLLELGVETTRDELHLAYYGMIAAADRNPSLDKRGVALGALETRRWIMAQLLASLGASDEARDHLAPVLAQRTLRAFPGEGDIFCWAMPGLRQRLEHLAALGFALAVASNNDGSLERQLHAVGVIDLLPVRLDSALEGVSKPDPELLLRAAARLGVTPERCLYVGDIDRVDGAAARGAGMRFALLDPTGQPRPQKLCTLRSLDDIPLHFRPRSRRDGV